MSERIIHKDVIRCPECSYLQTADVVQNGTMPFATFIHTCKNCEYTIMESEWCVVEISRVRVSEDMLTAQEVSRFNHAFFKTWEKGKKRSGKIAALIVQSSEEGDADVQIEAGKAYDAEMLPNGEVKLFVKWNQHSKE